MYLEIQHQDRISLENVHKLNVDENVRQFMEEKITELRYFQNIQIEDKAYMRILNSIRRYNNAQK